MTTPTPAVRAAEKMISEYKIGRSYFSKTCNKTVFDYAEPSELAQIITTEFAPMVEALEEIERDAASGDKARLRQIELTARKALQLLKESK